MDLSSLPSLAVFIVANFIAACSGAFFRPGDWYEALNHPSWRPPNWLFPVVWTPMYAIIAVSGWMIWQAAGWSGGSMALAVYGLHLVLNFLWSGLFFGMRRLDYAFYELLLLWGTLVATMILFNAIDPMAMYLLIPYLIWVTFAGFLNYRVWQLNKPAPF